MVITSVMVFPPQELEAFRHQTIGLRQPAPGLDFRDRAAEPAAGQPQEPSLIAGRQGDEGHEVSSSGSGAA
jgi:hypothetical protein